MRRMLEKIKFIVRNGNERMKKENSHHQKGIPDINTSKRKKNKYIYGSIAFQYSTQKNYYH